MNEIIEKEKIVIEDIIYEVRGVQVMLDSDIAKLYQVETKRINEAVKNNPEKFPLRYCFRIIENEYDYLKSNFSTSKERGGSRKGHNVFTEEGVWMLSTILKSKVATSINIKIIDAFVYMRKYISTNLIEQKYINNQVMKNTEDIKILQDSFTKFKEKKKVNEIYFKGQIYNAYLKILDILNTAKEEIIVIDSFLDKSILDMIRNIDVNVILITSNKSKLKETDIEKYQLQYTNLVIKYDNTFHDRYIIVDKNTIYHLDASINHAGSKTFSINILEDEMIKDLLVNSVKINM